MMHVDFICGQCPLEDCDEQSLWCALRFATKPNRAQRTLINQLTRAQAQHRAEHRREYLSTYYQQNREKKLAAANARNRAKRRAAVRG